MKFTPCFRLLLGFVFSGLLLPLQAQDPNPGACIVVGPNLIENPEFDEGNVGFQSSYTFFPDFTCGFGQYTIAPTVINDPIGGAACYNNTGFDLTTIWAASDRNDPGNGNFLILDPTDTTGGNFVIWTQTVDVCPNSEYTFSIFAKNLYYQEASFPYSGIDPDFDLTVNGNPVSFYYVNGVAAPNNGDFDPLPQQSIADSAVWTQISGRWQSGTETQATLTVKNIVPGDQGNDIAIDGLFFGLCSKDVSFSPNQDIGQCAQNNTIAPVTLTVSPPTVSSGWQSYEWFKNGALIQSDPNPIPFVTPADANGEYFGVYQLKVYEDPLGSSSGACGQVSKVVEIFDDCNTLFPVEFLAFDASIEGDRVALDWATAWESQNRGFEVQMATATGDFAPLEFVRGAGNAQEPRDYHYVTPSLAPATYRFRLRQEDYDGQYEYSQVLEVKLEAPDLWKLSIAPNPAYDEAEVNLSMALPSPVKLELLSADGRIIHRRIFEASETASVLQYQLPVANLSPGLYVVRAYGTQSVTQTLVVR